MNLFQMRRTTGLILLFVLTAGTILAACTLGGANPTSASPTSGQSTSTGSNQIPNTGGNSPVNHAATPASLLPGALSIANDANTQLAANLHWATAGDVYALNLFERPFTQNGMDYLPAVDIQNLKISKDGDWFYGSLQLAGVDPSSNSLNADYGLELDLNRDGRGDVLIWAKPPFTTTWSTTGLKVYTDKDGDVGGPNPFKSDAPFSGDSYENVIFDGGQGADPDLAWVRIAPDSPKTIQFAFKNSLLNGSTAFSVGGWADADIKDPSKFNYNDHFTLADAGSAMHGDPNYPVKALYALDSTCRAAVGYKPTSSDLMDCQLAPTPTPTIALAPPGTPPTPTLVPIK